VDWRERYERAAARYAAGETRELDERQLVQLANAAWAAGLSLLMAGDRQGAAEWLRRSAARYRESWEAGSATDAWGRPIGALKALLIAGDDASETAHWTLETCLGISYRDMSTSVNEDTAEPARRPSDGGNGPGGTRLGISYRDMSVSPIGRYAGAVALLVLGRDEEAAAVVATLDEDFPREVAAVLAALAARDAQAYRVAAGAIRRSFARRADFLEDIPVPDTALALDALAARRGLS
jgi:hypothetical protein